MPERPSWDERYKSGDTPWDSGRPSEEMVRVLAETNIVPCRAVELGCGTGTNAVWLAQRGFDVTAIDISPLALAQAQRRAADAGVRVRFLQANVLAPSPELTGPFDFLFDRGCYHVVRRDHVDAFLTTLRHITRRGSMGLVLAGNAKEPHDPGPPVVSEAELRAELASVFEIVQLREFRFDTDEHGGVRFLGWSALLRRPASE
jgi:SAM-dependent methyltransferase